MLSPMLPDLQSSRLSDDTRVSRGSRLDLQPVGDTALETIFSHTTNGLWCTFSYCLEFCSLTKWVEWYQHLTICLVLCCPVLKNTRRCMYLCCLGFLQDFLIVVESLFCISHSGVSTVIGFEIVLVLSSGSQLSFLCQFSYLASMLFGYLFCGLKTSNAHCLTSRVVCMHTVRQFLGITR